MFSNVGSSQISVTALNRLKWSILYLVLEHSEELEIAEIAEIAEVTNAQI
jgi:hypothetical protein